MRFWYEYIVRQSIGTLGNAWVYLHERESKWQRAERLPRRKGELPETNVTRTDAVGGQRRYS